MNTRSAHPSREELSAYSLGQLPEDKAVAIDTHISECDPCCETIVALSSDDTFAGLLQEAGRLSIDQTPDCDRLMAQSPSSPDDIPAPLAGHPRYEIVNLIGKGGMGDVYEARHRLMNRTVALKVINREFIARPEVVERFRREVETAAQLAHPNIVTAYDAEQAGDVHFLVMEHVDGTDLSRVVKDRGPLPVEQACDYVRQAALGLEEAHRLGLVHRDIKPHNLMVTADNTVKVLDFGLASLVAGSRATESEPGRSDLTSAGTVMGTPDFISPEQAADARNADARSDIYSLGATLYFLLTGRPLFAEGDVTQKLRSHAEVEPDPLTSVREDLPKGLAEVVSKMIAKDPAGRFQTAGEVVVALEPFVRRDTSKTDVPAVSEQPPRRRGSFSRLTVFVVGFAALLLAAAVYFIVTNNGVVRIEVLDDSLTVKIDGERVELDENGKRLVDFRAGDHEIVVRQGETELITDKFELRRNGEVRFRVTVEEGQVILAREGKPKKMVNLPGQRPAVEWPELRITNAEVESTRLGEVTRSWKLTGRKVGVATARLWYVNDGKMQVANERQIDSSQVAGDMVGHLSFTSVDRPGDKIALSIDMTLTAVGESPANSLDQKSEPLIVDKGIVASSMTKNAQWDNYGLDANEVVLVYWYSRLPKTFDSIQHGDDLESMVEASRKGASFVVLTLDWVDRDSGKSTTIPRSDLNAIRGMWKLVSTNGKPPRATDPGFEAGIVFGEKTLEGLEPTDAPPAPYSLDPTTTPKQIDIRPADEPAMLGIYELEADTLRIGFSSEEGKRPTSFARSFLVLTLRWKSEDANNRDEARESGVGNVDSLRGRELPRFAFGDRVESLEYSRDGKRLISSGSGWGTAVWDAATGDLIRHVPEEGAYLEASLSPDGTLMATSAWSARTVQVRRVETGEVVCSIDGGFRAVRFAPDGKSVFTVVGNRVARFDVATGEQLPAFADVGGGSSTFAVAPTGTLVAGIASPRSMAVWDWKEQKEVARARSLRMGQGNARDIVFTPDGQSLVLLGEKNTGADLRDARTLEVAKEFPGDENNKSTCVSVSADGRRIAFGAEGGLVFVYDLETGELVNSWQAHTSHIAALALSPDGTRLACGTRRSGSVKIWNVETLKPVFSPDTREEAIAGRGTSEGHPPRMANDIVERLEQAGRFTRLLEAVDAADLEELLYLTRGLTLFAPTDEAFEALAPEGTLEALLQPENKDRLADLLRYHFVNGALTTKDLASTSFEAANGKSIDVVDREGVLSLNESRITGSEIVCSNGIVHVIDAVLLPSDVRAEVSPHWKNGKLSDPVSVYAIANKTIRTPVVQLAPNIEFKSDEFEFDINDYPQKSLRANTEILVGWPTNIELHYRPRDGYRGPLPEANLKHAVHWVFVDTEGQRHELAAGYGHTMTIGGGKSGGVTLFSQEELTEGHFEVTFYETLLTKARWRDEWRTPLTRSDLILPQGD